MGAPTWRERWRRWPVKVGAAIGAAFLAWAVSFIGPKLFDKAATSVQGDKPPLAIAVVSDIARFTSPADASKGVAEFLYRGPVAKLGAPPDGDDPQRSDERWSWAHELGAVDAFSALVRLKVGGTAATPVILDNLRVEVTKRGPPPEAWDLSYLGLGSAQGVRYFEVNLDKPSPVVHYVGKDNPLPLRVTASDVEVIDLLVATSRCDCEWKAKLDWVSGSEQGTTTIDDHGKPFHVAAARLTRGGGPRRRIAWSHGRWMLTAPDGRLTPAHD